MCNKLGPTAIMLILIAAIFLSGFRLAEKTVADFKLKNTDGQYVSLSDYKTAKGFIVVFTCNHCPFAKRYPGRLKEMNQKYKPLGVPLIAISSADTLLFAGDAYAKMVEKARAEQFNYPYLYDGALSVARNFGAQKTPHAFVIWHEAGKWVVKYDGAIDDNGAEPTKVQHHYVADAVDALLKGQPVPLAKTKSIGCSIRLN